MANAEHLKKLTEGIRPWNQWRIQLEVTPDLEGADLNRANLANANFFRTNLSGANLQNASLEGANLEQAYLIGANLYGANLRGAKLEKAYLDFANLFMANLSEAKLPLAYLYESDLAGANLLGASLWGANLIRCNLYGAHLQGADLRGAQLIETKLQQADLTGARVYGLSAWNVQQDESTKQTGLIITSENEPVITVDDLEVAQFVYLLIRNKNIRNVIDTVAKKAILILGRFTNERKEVLEAIASKLRDLDLVPIIFDFEKSDQLDIIETVKTLAAISKFIIADVTGARVIQDELRSIVPDFSVPVVPLFQPSKEEPEPYASLRTLKIFPWFLKIVEYTSKEQLVQILLEEVIKPAEDMQLELRKIK